MEKYIKPLVQISPISLQVGIMFSPGQGDGGDNQGSQGGLGAPSRLYI